MKTLGKRIRLLRHERSWNQEDVAKRLHISIPAFSKIETGITDVNLSRLEELSSLFEMSVVQLLTLNQDEQTEQKESDLEFLAKKLHDREIQVMNLQKTMIDLLEEIRNSNP